MSSQSGKYIRNAPRVNMNAILFLFIIGNISARAGAEPHCPSPDNLSAARNALQLLVVTNVGGWNTSKAKIQTYERSDLNSPWKEAGPSIAAVSGIRGMGWGAGFENLADGKSANKIEGDNLAPAGIFALGKQFGIDSSEKAKKGDNYISIGPNTNCVDDPTNPDFYNRFSELDRKWKSAEHMADYTTGGSKGTQYNQGVEIKQNPNNIRGKGSCVFLHIWKDAQHGTAGCSAMQEGDMNRVAHWLDPQKNPAMIQMPEENYNQMRSCPGINWPQAPADPTIRAGVRPPLPRTGTGSGGEG